MRAKILSVYAILLNWNGADDTIECLKSLSLLKGEYPKVIVCDNASTDNSWQKLQAYVATQDILGIQLIQTGSNLGFAAGNNVGLRIALSDPSMEFVWILNNDTEVAPDALNALLQYMVAHPKVGICGSTLLYLDEPNLIQAVGGKFNSWLGTSKHLLGHHAYSEEVCTAIDSSAIDYVVGASMFVRRILLEEIGLLGEEYFLYYEEIDWATRMKRETPQWLVGYAPKSIIYHKEGGATGANDLAVKSYNFLTDYYFITSRLKFTRKFYPYRVVLVRISMLGVALNRLRRRQYRSMALALCVFAGYIPNFLVPLR